MATPPSSTRQQLDELDALLQKMLNLPLSRLDEPATAPPTPYMAASPPPAVAAQPAPARRFMAAPAPVEPMAEVMPPPAPPRAVPQPPPPPMPRTMPPPPPVEAVVPPPVAPAPRTETVFDSSWKVEIPGSPPAPPPSVFRGWTAETDPLAGPPRRPKPAPQRLQPAPEETQPEPEMIRFRSPWSEATPPAPVQPMPQPMPQPVAEMHMAPMPAPMPYAENAPLPAMHFGQPRSDLPATHVPSTAQPIEPTYMAEPAPQPVYAQPTYQPAPMPTPVPVAVARNDNALSPQYAPTVWYLWPLLGLNMLVDLVLNIAGPPGRFFTTRTGRNVMGWVGALLMATAIGIGVCDYLQISWTP